MSFDRDRRRFACSRSVGSRGDSKTFVYEATGPRSERSKHLLRLWVANHARIDVSGVRRRPSPGKPMREFRIPLSIVNSDTLTRGQAISRHAMGHECPRFAGAGILTVVGPDSSMAIEDTGRSWSRDEFVEGCKEGPAQAEFRSVRRVFYVKDRSPRRTASVMNSVFSS